MKKGADQEIAKIAEKYPMGLEDSRKEARIKAQKASRRIAGKVPRIQGFGGKWLWWVEPNK